MNCLDWRERVSLGGAIRYGRRRCFDSSGGVCIGTENRGMLITGWCPQEKVLSHPAIGGFLTHCGWNSTLESLFAGFPMICWPFLADQLTNRKFCCEEWGIGMEIGEEVKREKVEAVVRELMDGEKGIRLREKVVEWRRVAEEALAPPSGSSYVKFETVVNKVLLSHDYIDLIGLYVFKCSVELKKAHYKRPINFAKKCQYELGWLF